MYWIRVFPGKRRTQRERYRVAQCKRQVIKLGARQHAWAEPEALLLGKVAFVGEGAEEAVE